MGKFWIAHVLGRRNIYFGVKKSKISKHLLPKKCCFSQAGPYSTKTAQLKGVLSGSTNSRRWNVKASFSQLCLNLRGDRFLNQVTQVLCSSQKSPWNGCLQYFTGVSGTVSRQY